MFFFTFSIVYSAQLLQTQKQARNLDDGGNKIVYHIHENVLTRKIEIDPQYDVRDSQPKQLEQSAERFEYDQDSEGNLIFRKNSDLNLKISDLDKIEEFVTSIMEQFQEDMLMGIKTPDEKSQLDRSVQFYNSVNVLVDNYHLYKNGLEQLAMQIHNIILYAKDYIANSDEHDLSQVLTEEGLELDQYNKNLLISNIDKMVGKSEQLWNCVFNDIRKAYQQMEQGIQRTQKEPKQGIEDKIKGTINLTIIENNLKTNTTQLNELNEKILNNHKYHLMSQSFSQPLDLGTSLDTAETMISQETKKIQEAAFGLSSVTIFSTVYMILSLIIQFQ